MKSFNRLFVVWIVFVVLIMGGLITLGYIYKNKLSSYHKYEEKLIVSAKKYVNDNNISLKKNEKKVINISNLIKDKYLSKKDIIKECTGNVTIFLEKNIIKYDPYIKCKYYKTK